MDMSVLSFLIKALLHGIYFEVMEMVSVVFNRDRNW